LLCAIRGLARSDVLGDVHKDENICMELDTLEKHIHSFGLRYINVCLHWWFPINLLLSLFLKKGFFSNE